MPVKIAQGPRQTGFMDSKAFKVGMGFATGGPVGAAMALAGSSNPGLGAIGRAVGAAGGGGESNGPVEMEAPQAINPNQATQQMQQQQNQQMQAQPDSPVARAIQARTTDPKFAVMDGLSALEDPSVPDYIRQEYAQPLLMAKHYKMGRIG